MCEAQAAGPAAIVCPPRRCWALRPRCTSLAWGACPPSLGVPGAGSRPEKPASILRPGEGDAEVPSREASLPQPQTSLWLSEEPASLPVLQVGLQKTEECRPTAPGGRKPGATSYTRPAQPGRMPEHGLRADTPALPCAPSGSGNRRWKSTADAGNVTLGSDRVTGQQERSPEKSKPRSGTREAFSNFRDRTCPSVGRMEARLQAHAVLGQPCTSKDRSDHRARWGAASPVSGRSGFSVQQGSEGRPLWKLQAGPGPAGPWRSLTLTALTLRGQVGRHLEKAGATGGREPAAGRGPAPGGACPSHPRCRTLLSGRRGVPGI